jgi:hypothetical protein
MAVKPRVLQQNLFAIQVCVPKYWHTKRIEKFANISVPSGTEKGWQVRTEPQPGEKVRQPCASHANFVHVVLEV